MSAFNDIPGSELYIFPSQSPSPNATAVDDPAGQVPQAFAYSFSQVQPTPLSGGSIKFADSTVFPIAQTIAVAEVSVAPGGMRELHVSSSLGDWITNMLTTCCSGTLPRTSGLTSSRVRVV